MITGIAIENFKGIGQRIDIPIKPITLLFGPNSAGKSSIIHALHYAREIFERGNLNPDFTISGGKFVDLGGFRGLVHQHDLKKSVKIAIDLDLRIRKLPTYDDTPPYDCADEDAVDLIGDRSDPPNDLLAEVESARVEAEISWSEPKKRPYVSGYSVSLDGHPIGSVKSDENGNRQLTIYFRHPSLIRIQEHWGLHSELLCSVPTNLLHLRWFLRKVQPESDDVAERMESVCRLLLNEKLAGEFADLADELSTLSADAKGDVSFSPELKQRLSNWTAQSKAHLATTANERSALEAALFVAIGWGTFTGLEIQSDFATIPLSPDARSGVLPQWNSQLQFEWDWSIVENLLEPANKPYLGEDGQFAISAQNCIQHWMYETISRAIVGPGQLVRDCLAEFRYLGPLREMPPRDYVAPNFPEDSRWASGLGAWDALESGSSELVEKSGEWLASRDRLDAGCTLRRKRYREVDLDDPTTAQSEKTRLVIVPNGHPIELRPHDVGVGISQLVPVVVTALQDEAGLSAIEQPELHLHPRLQTRLGDLFISAIAKPGRSFLIETHSEHLILRLLRRIRETNCGELPKGHFGLRPEQVGVYYVESHGGNTKVSELRIDETGEFVDRWPSGFFEERAEELF